MGDTQTFLTAVGAGGMITLFFLYIRLKKTLKEEIVDPDIKRLEQKMSLLENSMADKISRMEESTSRSAANLDRKFEELNAKLDSTAQKVSQMQGMLTALFNGLRENANYGQQ